MAWNKRTGVNWTFFSLLANLSVSMSNELIYKANRSAPHLNEAGKTIYFFEFHRSFPPYPFSTPSFACRPICTLLMHNKTIENFFYLWHSGFTYYESHSSCNSSFFQHRQSIYIHLYIYINSRLPFMDKH